MVISICQHPTRAEAEPGCAACQIPARATRRDVLLAVCAQDRRRTHDGEEAGERGASHHAAEAGDDSGEAESEVVGRVSGGVLSSRAFIVFDLLSLRALSLRFTGKVRAGMGRHKQMVVPGRKSLLCPPDGWPEMFAPGSLNVELSPAGYPPGFHSPQSGGSGIRSLDSGIPTPALVLSADQIHNNSLKATTGEPRRGIGQFWRVVLTNVSTGQSVRCWLFRRIGSTMKAPLELIADCSLREKLSLTDGADAYVDLVRRRLGDSFNSSNSCFVRLGSA